ncbi:MULTISPECIES: GNAT family N-acetyltransferase [unclassified Sporosarcina]|uniref:GNAT family N-acetyltransferase n=1 Tax=unclassified Sporosarcina TaxID=2647733 RepID=UPI000C167B38|nr:MULTISPECIES: GNAT family N-acetyltransferase [unclassified Sporosarcina]PID00815.1 N-acetyltransferase [Sporosarcina sp. P29]PID07125.1 N-acetyltransferase [Sporosarcina sp. P30]PID10321.1 N-acetyltransferase [Sporosarcina sp. P31]PID12905.1 N-acetyltransferase [Sporosarcina sp. P32b]
MEHKKTYFSRSFPHDEGELVIEGPVSPERLAAFEFHEGLKAFRPSKQQQEALVKIAAFPEGRINVARIDNMVVGYVTYLYPDPLERWYEANMDNLIELGAVEVVAAYRGARIGKSLLELSMLDDAVEDYIIITTEYYWHWDLKGTGLTVWEYRKMMEKMMRAGGMEFFSTDDPEVSSHPANALMARIGKRVDQESIERFDRVRFKNRVNY